MRYFDYSPRLFAPAGEPLGGGSGTILDGGIPHEHDDGDGEEPEPTTEQTPEQKRIAALESELATERTERQRAADDAKFWANRNRNAGDDNEDLGDRVGEEDDDLTPEQKAAAELREKLSPEDMLDLLAKEGAKGLAKLGFVTAEQLHREVRAAEARGERKMGALTADQSFEKKLGDEWPDLVADSERVANGQKPQTELFRRAGQIYREAVALDPQLKGSKSLLLTSTRQAGAELGLKPANAPRGGAARPQQRDTTPTNEPRVSRRDRVNAQRPSTDVGDENDDDQGGPTEGQLHVAKMLKVSPKELAANLGGARPGRRGRG